MKPVIEIQYNVLHFQKILGSLNEGGDMLCYITTQLSEDKKTVQYSLAPAFNLSLAESLKTIDCDDSIRTCIEGLRAIVEQYDQGKLTRFKNGSFKLGDIYPEN